MYILNESGMVILHQCCFYKKEIQMFSFVKGFKSSCGNIHKSMPGRGELVLFSSLRAGEKTGSVSFRRSGLALRWVLAPGCRQTRVMEPHPGEHPGEHSLRRPQAGWLPRKTLGTARRGCLLRRRIGHGCATWEHLVPAR